MRSDGPYLPYHNNMSDGETVEVCNDNIVDSDPEASSEISIWYTWVSQDVDWGFNHRKFISWLGLKLQPLWTWREVFTKQSITPFSSLYLRLRKT